MHKAVTILSPSALSELAGAAVNPFLTIIALPEPGQSELRYFVSDWRNGPHERAMQAVQYLEQLREVALGLGISISEGQNIILQAEDVPVHARSTAWEAQNNWSDVRLIPDLYYFWGRGYEDFQPTVVPWEDRRPSVIWRGSSTGLLSLTLNNLDSLPRYRMCRLAEQLGPMADVGLSDVVQAADLQQDQLIRDRLRSEGFLRPFVPMQEMAQHRLILDIDGNANSWNFMLKLRLGCCILQVESPWRQWFSDRLIAWEHYVPIAANLSNLLERLDWCFANPSECAKIAEHGQQFAFGMEFREEMSRAAHATFAPYEAVNVFQPAKRSTLKVSRTGPLPEAIGETPMPTLQKIIIDKLYETDPWEQFVPDATAELQGWNGDHPSLARLSATPGLKLVVDVGVWKGQSTIRMARAMRDAGIDGCVIAVDTFLGSPEHWRDAGLFKRVHGMPDLYSIFMSNVWAAGVQDYVVPLPQTSVTAAKILQDAGLSPSLVHVDAAHEYPEVLRDTQEYWAILAPGGYLIGDDYDVSWPGVVQAAGEFSSKVGRPLTIELPKWILQKA